MLSGFFEKVYSAIKDITRGYMDDTISEFAQKVRSVLREEMDGMISKFAQKVRFVMREEIQNFAMIIFILYFTIWIIRCFIISMPSQRVRRRREQQLDTMERTILNISERLSRMAERQADGDQSALAEEVQRLKSSLHSKTKTICTWVQGLKTTVDGAHSSSGSIATLTDEVRQLKAKMNEMQYYSHRTGAATKGHSNTNSSDNRKHC